MTEYDRRNLPLKMAVEQTNGAVEFVKYSYNDSGNRTIRENKDAMERYLYDASGRAVAVYNITTNQIKYAYLYGNDMIGKIDFTSTPERFYNVKDHLGSTRLVYDDNGSVVDRMDYYPYGEFLGSRNLTGMQEGDTKFHFTGKERDFESGYDYFGARYYNNRLGLWNSVDPLADIYLGWSPYNYVLNNPIRYVDLFGLGHYDKETDTYIPDPGETVLDEVVVSASNITLPSLQEIELNRQLNNKEAKETLQIFSGVEAITGYTAGYSYFKSEEKMLNKMARQPFKINRSRTFNNYNVKYLKPLKIAGRILFVTGVITDLGYGLYTQDFTSAGISIGAASVSLYAPAVGFVIWGIATFYPGGLIGFGNDSAEGIPKSNIDYPNFFMTPFKQ